MSDDPSDVELDVWATVETYKRSNKVSITLPKVRGLKDDDNEAGTRSDPTVLLDFVDHRQRLHRSSK